MFLIFHFLPPQFPSFNFFNTSVCQVISQHRNRLCRQKGQSWRKKQPSWADLAASSSFFLSFFAPSFFFWEQIQHKATSPATYRVGHFTRNPRSKIELRLQNSARKQKKLNRLTGFGNGDENPKREGEEIGGVAEAERLHSRGSELRGDAEREIQRRREGQLRMKWVKNQNILLYIYIFICLFVFFCLKKWKYNNCII